MILMSRDIETSQKHQNEKRKPSSFTRNRAFDVVTETLNFFHSLKACSSLLTEVESVNE
jgi:hypothetical protein